MLHIVKSGDTLSKIARTHGITVAELLAANPEFRADPDRIRPGDVVAVPVGRASTSGAVTPQEPRDRTLGKLSERFETGGRGPGTVSSGAGDAGGVSYGSYQMTSVPRGGTVTRFVSQRHFPFRQAFAGLKAGTQEFTAAWKKLAKAHPTEFQASQHAFIRKTHFDPLVQKIVREDGLDVRTRSHALSDVIWSTAVQHGGATSIPHRSLSAVHVAPDHPDFDAQFIAAIYAERGREDAQGRLVHFSRNSAAVQKSVANRFREERRHALAMLAAELPV